MRRKLFIVLVLLMLFALPVANASAAPADSRFHTHMTGDAAGTSSKAQGQANFKLVGDTIHLIATASKLEGETTTAAHIHIAAEPGGNGPPVVTLCGSGPGPTQPACNNPGVFAKGTRDLADFSVTAEELLTAISENRAYVNVHSTAYPAGEIRGDLSFHGP